MKTLAWPERLEFAAYDITSVCGNNCTFCYRPNRKHIPKKEEVELVLKRLADARVKSVLFVGGDPCLYPNFIEEIRFARRLGLRAEILSNTLQFREKELKELVGRVRFYATILGENAKKHNKLAGNPKAYQVLVKSIRKINEFEGKVGICLTIDSKSAGQIERIIDSLVKAGLKIDCVVLQRIMLLGKPKENKKVQLKKRQINKVFEQLERIGKKYKIRTDVEEPFPLCKVDKKYHYLSVPCKYGRIACGIDSKGNVRRCAIGGPIIGNIYEKPWMEILGQSQIIKDFKSPRWLPKKCFECDLLEKCLGGCSISNCPSKDHDIDYYLAGEKK